MARGRPRKLDKMEGVATLTPASPPALAPIAQSNVTESIEAPESPAEEELFEDLDDVPQAQITLFDAMPAPVVASVAPATIADADLEDEAKRELARLLGETFSLTERARLLVKLAHHTDTKRAPVALRAIQEVNALTGITRERPADTMPMFQLPEGTGVSIVVEKVVK